MRIFLMAGAAALAMACTPAEEAENIAPGCDARAAVPWQAAGEQFSAEATTTGPDCQRAVATLVIRDSSGTPVYADVHMADHVMVLAPAQDAAAMETALREWLDQSSNTTMQTSSALPEWPANASSPQNGEFPFYPEEGFDRASYGALREANVPLFCYVQGMESMACLSLSDGGLAKIGVQSFPG